MLVSVAILAQAILAQVSSRRLRRGGAWPRRTFGSNLGPCWRVRRAPLAMSGSGAAAACVAARRWLEAASAALQSAALALEALEWQAWERTWEFEAGGGWRNRWYEPWPKLTKTQRRRLQRQRAAARGNGPKSRSQTEQKWVPVVRPEVAAAATAIAVVADAAPKRRTGSESDDGVKRRRSEQIAVVGPTMSSWTQALREIGGAVRRPPQSRSASADPPSSKRPRSASSFTSIRSGWTEFNDAVATDMWRGAATLNGEYFNVAFGRPPPSEDQSQTSASRTTSVNSISTNEVGARSSHVRHQQILRASARGGLPSSSSWEVPDRSFIP